MKDLESQLQRDDRDRDRRRKNPGVQVHSAETETYRDDQTDHISCLDDDP
jgi:hypothetical protein